MIVGKNLRKKYARCLINHHLLIFVSIFFVFVLSSTIFCWKKSEIDLKNFVKGFRSFGTKISDDHRKLISLLRETRSNHFFPHSTNNFPGDEEIYPDFESHDEFCSERFYSPRCPIVEFSELKIELKNRSGSIFDDENIWKNFCQIEMIFHEKIAEKNFCFLIGPIGLLIRDEKNMSKICEETSKEEIKFFEDEWNRCSNSSCSNVELENYLKELDSKSILKIYFVWEKNLINVKNSLKIVENFSFEWKFGKNAIEDILIENFRSNIFHISLTIIFCLICLLVLVKNVLFVFIVVSNIFFSFILSLIVFVNIFEFPLSILNFSSLTTLIFINFIDGIVWLKSWSSDQRRRDDCTLQRKLENVLTQTFYFCFPKNFISIVIFMISYTNRIIALRSFNVFSSIYLFNSFLISFTLYPVCLICILRYHSWIPRFENFHQKISSPIDFQFFLDRSILFLIVRLKTFLLILFFSLSLISFLVIFYWPKLNSNISQMNIEITKRNFCPMKNNEIDVTFYIGSNWQIPSESFIPSKEFPILDYNDESKMSLGPSNSQRFSYVLSENFHSLIEFCSNFWSIEKTFLSNSTISIKKFFCFADISLEKFHLNRSNSKLTSIIEQRNNSTKFCHFECFEKNSTNDRRCFLCFNEIFYKSNPFDDLFLLKNGLRFISDSENPRYLLQTVRFKINSNQNQNYFRFWSNLFIEIEKHFLTKFYRKTFSKMSIWWSSERFSNVAIMEILEQEIFSLVPMKFFVILILLFIFTGVLGIFASFTIFLNFLTSIAILTLLNFDLSIENNVLFNIILHISCQYSILFSMSYKLAPTFFFQRENRSLYSLKELCKTMFLITCSMMIISSPCLFSSFEMIFKMAICFTIAPGISFIYSTIFLQSILCLVGPRGDGFSRLNFFRQIKIRRRKSIEMSTRRSSSNPVRRHQRMSTSSYFSQMFTGSTYFESDFTGINEVLMINGRRRESSRSYATIHGFKRSSFHANELFEIYSPRTSLAPLNHYRNFSRPSNVSRVTIQNCGTNRPFYISPSITPHSQLSIHSQTIQSRAPSPLPRSTEIQSNQNFLRPCHSAPRLHRSVTTNVKENKTLISQNNILSRKTLTTIQRQKALSSTDHIQQNQSLNAQQRRNLMKSTNDQTGSPSWLKRSNSS